jgi:hypothetical protein
MVARLASIANGTKRLQVRVLRWSFFKPRDEQDEIELEIEDLEQAVPAITQDYKLIDRLGTGTFSSVYKAIDLGYHEKWDNSVWHGLHPVSRPPTTSQRCGRPERRFSSPSSAYM